MGSAKRLCEGWTDVSKERREERERSASANLPFPILVKYPLLGAVATPKQTDDVWAREWVGLG